MRKRINRRAALVIALTAVLVFSAVLLAVWPRIREMNHPPIGSRKQPDIFIGQAERIAAAETGSQSAEFFEKVISDRKEAVKKAKAEKKKKAAKAKEQKEKEEQEKASVLEAARKQEEKEIESGLYEIMGTSSVSAKQMASHYKSYYDYPGGALADGGAPTIEDFCQIICDEASAEGVRPEIVYAQAMIETGWLKFQGGADSVTQYNFAGLGTVGDGNHGNVFPDVRTGIRAQVQHLKAYACKDPLVNECVDQRFDMIPRGCAPYVQWLGIQENPAGIGWAAGKGYGDKIMNMIMKIRSI